MAQSVGVYKNGVVLGTGSLTTNSITSYSGIAPQNRRNVQVLIKDGTSIGRSYSTRITAGSGTATLTLNDPSPFA